MRTTKAPDFDLGSLSGERTSLGGLLSSGPVVLSFFKVTCPTCQLTFPFLERLHLGGKARIVAISQDDAEATRAFNQRFGVTFNTLLDLREEGYRVSNAYRITDVPTLVVVEADGSVSQTVAGFDKAALESLAGRFSTPVFRPDDRVPVFRPG